MAMHRPSSHSCLSVPIKFKPYIVLFMRIATKPESISVPIKFKPYIVLFMRIATKPESLMFRNPCSVSKVTRIMKVLSPEKHKFKKLIVLNRFNHTSWVTAVTPTDRPKSVRNSCVIKVFGGVFMLSR